MDEAVVLVADKLHRLGASIELDGRVSWFPAATRGYAPANSYLLTADSVALVVDPGLPAVEAPLLRQLRQLLAPGSELWVLPTRTGEFDSLGNTAAIVSELPVSRVYGPIVLHPQIGFQPRFELPPAEEDTSWPVDDSVEWPVFRAGDMIELEPGRAVEVIRTPIKVLGTTWLYDAGTRTLFTSDFFNHVVRKSPDDSCVLADDDPDTTTVAEIEDVLRQGKFSWLALADTGDFVEGLAALFAEREIETIAPGYGCVLSGQAVVERHLELMLEALAGVGVPLGSRAQGG